MPWTFVLLLALYCLLPPAQAAWEPEKLGRNLTALAKPSPAPDFTLKDMDDESYSFVDYRGKVVLLNFWATWCPPCMQEIPGFIEVQHDLSGQDFQIVGVAVDNEDAVRKFASENGVNYPLLPGEDEAIELADRYGNRSGGLPYSVLIDKNGNISDTITGELNKTRLKNLLVKLGLRV
jgi:peroxiredoxin